MIIFIIALGLRLDSAYIEQQVLIIVYHSQYDYRDFNGRGSGKLIRPFPDGSDFTARNVRLSRCEFSAYLYISIQYTIYNTRVGCSRGYSHEIACVGMRWFFRPRTKATVRVIIFFYSHTILYNYILHYKYIYI